MVEFVLLKTVIGFRLSSVRGVLPTGDRGQPKAETRISNMYFLYILRSRVKQRTYIGVCQNIKKRIREHNAGFVRSTKAYRPYVLIHTESFLTKGKALAREYKLKHHSQEKEILYKEIISGNAGGPMV